MSESKREERLREVERLSRKPHQEIHALLVDVALQALNGLTHEQWANLAAKAPDRVLQGLAMSARMSGYSDKIEARVEGSLDVHSLSDMELENRARALAEETFRRLEVWPPLRRAISSLMPKERHESSASLPVPVPWCRPWSTPQR